MHTSFLTALVTALFLSTPLAAQYVGFTRLTLPDPMGGEMTVSLWYPSPEAGETLKLGPYKFTAARNGAPSEGKHPLVLISHGTEGSDLGHRNIAIALAQRGIIAAAPLHPRDNFRDASGVGRRIVMEGRPRQITATIDALLTSDWGERIEPQSIGAFGFSLGGYTVLAALGAAPDMARIAAHCGASNEDPFCRFAGADPETLHAHIAQEFSEPLTELTEPRLCAASIADPVAVPFSDVTLAGIKARHIQIWLPEHQNVLSAKAHGTRVTEQLNTRSFAEPTPETVVAGAQHYSFLAPFPWRLSWTLPSELTRDAKGFDRTAFQERFAEGVAEFLSKSVITCAKP